MTHLILLLGSINSNVRLPIYKPSRILVGSSIRYVHTIYINPEPVYIVDDSVTPLGDQAVKPHLGPIY